MTGPTDPPTDPNPVDGRDIAPASLKTESQIHGQNVTDDLGEKNISPDVADAGAAINTAISELAPVGGRIKLPRGKVPIETTVDLNDGANGQKKSTPVIIEGHGSRGVGQADTHGTTLDATNLSGSAFACTTGRRSVTLKEFTVENPPRDADTIKIRGGDNRNSRIQSVTVDGLLTNPDGTEDFYGFNLDAFFGGVLDQLYALRCDKGIRLTDTNACNAGLLMARLCKTEGPAVQILNAGGMNTDLIYVESCQGTGISLAGTFRGSTIDQLYFENNNRSGNATSELILGDSSLNASASNYFSIGGARFSGPANAFGSQRILCDAADHYTMKSVRGVPDLFVAADGRHFKSTYIGCAFGDVDTTNGGAGQWIGTFVSGTDNRNSGFVELLA